MNERDGDQADAIAAERVTAEEARRRSGAPDGLGEPAISAEADEPTTAPADRVKVGDGQPGTDPGPGPTAPLTGG